MLLATDAVLGTLAAVLALAQAVLVADVAARAFGGAGLRDVSGALTALAAVVLARGATTWGFEVAGRRAASDVLSQLRLDVITHRLRNRPAALDGIESAEVASAAVGGVEALENAYARYLPQMVLALIVPLAVLALAAVVDPVSAAVMLLTLPLVPVFMWLIGRSTERRANERRRALARLSTHFLDVVRGLPTLRAFNRGEAQTERIERVADDYRRATMGTLRLAFLSGTVLELAATLGIALVAVTVGVRLVEGGVGFEAGLTVLLLAPELYLPLRNLAAQYHASADGLAVAARLLDLLDDGADARGGTARPPTPLEAPIRLDHVSFGYPGRRGLVLDGLELELHPGETLALVGPTGCGKSTIVSLILRFGEPGSGRVLAGDDDLAACDPSAWREHIAWVPQRPTVFRGTVADNIRLGRAHADAEAVRRAAMLAGADEFVGRLPDGYESMVGDGGRPLSAGEVQRLALARAFLRDAPLLILDEPTADLDPEAAEHVVRAVDRLREGRSVLIVAHEAGLATVADRIVTLDGGRVVELTRDAA
jgi:thiol reductant ABC exporter CydD subunit